MAEWQTRRSQKPLRATSCGFDSRSRHQDFVFRAIGCFYRSNRIGPHPGGRLTAVLTAVEAGTHTSVQVTPARPGPIGWLPRSQIWLAGKGAAVCHGTGLVPRIRSRDRFTPRRRSHSGASRRPNTRATTTCGNGSRQANPARPPSEPLRCRPTKPARAGSLPAGRRPRGVRGRAAA